MCFGKKSSSAPAPAPTPVAPTEKNIADNSNDPQRMAAIMAAGPSAMSSFGSELSDATTSETSKS